MPIKVTLKDAAGKKHVVKLLHATSDSDAGEQAKRNLSAWAGEQTTTLKQPLTVESVEEVSK